MTSAAAAAFVIPLPYIVVSGAFLGTIAAGTHPLHLRTKYHHPTIPTAPEIILPQIAKRERAKQPSDR